MQEGDRRLVDAGVSVNLPPPVVMKLDSQGPPISYAQAASKQPKNTITKESVRLCDIRVRDAQWDKEKAAAQATLDCIA